MLIFSSKTRSSLKFFTTTNSLVSSIAYSTRQVFRRPDEWFTATSSSIILVAVEDLNDEGSETVFDAYYTVSKSLHDH